MIRSSRRALWGSALLLVSCSTALQVSSPQPNDPALEPEQPSAIDSASPAVSASADIAPAHTAPSAPMNVVLITIDSLRAEMPWTGYSRPIAPRLTEFSKKSVVYTHAYSVSSVTAKSIGGMLASKYPSEMFRSNDYFTRYLPDNLMFPEVLHDAGVKTAAAQAHWSLRADWGYGEGIDHYHMLPNMLHGRDADSQVTSQLLTPLAIQTLDEVSTEAKDKPFFMWVHYMDPHQKYRLHSDAPAWGSKPRDLYDGEVWYTDLWVGKLLDYIEKQSWASSTAIVITADHGEIFDEHHMGGHGFELWEALVRVPLLIKIPGVSHQTIDTPRSLIDLAPTMTALTGAHAPSSFRGQSLLGEIRGETPLARTIICDLPEDSQATQRRAVIESPLKYMIAGRNRSPRLFDIERDPSETNDLRQQQPSDFQRLEQVAAGIKELKPKKL
ncbi:MAG: sulfatase [Polyangiaceae bacterium]